VSTLEFHAEWLWSCLFAEVLLLVSQFQAGSRLRPPAEICRQRL
jgi:hypothetical protein